MTLTILAIKSIVPWLQWQACATSSLGRNKLEDKKVGLEYVKIILKIN